MRRFAVLLPCLWAPLCLLGYSHPGDEYGLWFAGSIAGVWPLALFDVSSPASAIPLLLAGGVGTTALAGWGLDRLRVSRLAWWVLAFLLAAATVEMSLAAFPDLEQARQKNGSLTAYLVVGAQVGTTLATVVLVLGYGAARGLLRMRRGPGWSRPGGAESAGRRGR